MWIERILPGFIQYRQWTEMKLRERPLDLEMLVVQERRQRLVWVAAAEERLKENFKANYLY